MLETLTPYFLDPTHVHSWKCQYCEEMIQSPLENYIKHGRLSHNRIEEFEEHRLLLPCDICGTYVKLNKYIVHVIPHLMEHE